MLPDHLIGSELGLSVRWITLVSFVTSTSLSLTKVKVFSHNDVGITIIRVYILAMYALLRSESHDGWTKSGLSPLLIREIGRNAL